MLNLPAGEYLHRIEVGATGQRQYRRDLLVAEPKTPNGVRWTVFKTVYIVNSTSDSGPGSLPDAASQANGGNADSRPWLIRFDHGQPGGIASIDLTSNRELRITAPGTVIDGTDAEGRPSPIAPFAARTCRTVITQDPADKTSD